MDKLEQEYRSAMGQWASSAGKPKRNRQTPIKADTLESTINKATRDVIQKMQGIIIPVHGDGACWYRAMLAKICKKTPMTNAIHTRHGRKCISTQT